MLNIPDPETILSRCLEELAALLGAEYGYVFATKPGGESIPPWWLVACRESSGGIHSVAGVSTSAYIPAPLLGMFRLGKTQAGNGAPPDPHPLPSGHPEIENYLCIPLNDARNIYGAIYLCNSAGGFQEEENGQKQEVRLRPFISAVGCLLRLSWQAHAEVMQPALNGHSDDKDIELEELIDALFNGVMVLDEQDRIVMCNRAAASLVGIPRRDLMGQEISRFLPNGGDALLNRTAMISTEDQHNNNGSVWRGVALRTAQGLKKLVDIRAVEMRQGKLTRRTVIFEDISEQMRSAAEYRATLQRFHALTAMAPVGILQLDRSWNCTFANDTWCDYTQMNSDELNGMGWLNSIHPMDCDQFLADIRREASANGQYQKEIRFLTPLGMIRWAKLTACGLYNEAGNLDGVIITFNDITEHLRTEERLREIAEQDQLTGLANRRHFHERLKSALESSERYGAVALMFIDLDNFKHINDTLGHDAGDELLLLVAERLKETIRKVDTISRIGGDEFTVIITHLKSTSTVKLVAEKLLQALALPFDIGGRTVYVTCSIGISVREENLDLKQFLKQADVALYKAKESGRNQYRFFTAELNRDASLLIHLRQSIRENIAEHFSVVYQPQIDVNSGKVVGLEALARWNSPDTESVGPEIFMKMIEQSGLIYEFSAWLFDEVFRQSHQWSAQIDEGVKIAINLSGRQFLSEDLVYSIMHCAQKHEVKPGFFALEVTETALVADTKLASDALERLRKMGFQVHLDDFGTGYSSLMYLRKMPLDCVKIDRSFTMDVLTDKEDAIIVSTILDLAAGLGLEVIAEGVESETVRDWLQERGCHIHQGYLYSKPLHPDDVSDILKVAAAHEAV